MQFCQFELFMRFHVFQTGNALFYCNLLNEIRPLHISVFRIRDNVILVCVCVRIREAVVLVVSLL